MNRALIERTLNAELEKPMQKTTCWECNECGSQEYTTVYSHDEACHAGCGSCGSDEFHLAEIKTP